MPIAVPRYTVDDLDRFPDDDQHYELLDGILLVTPAPALRHQSIVTAIMAPLLSAFPPGGPVALACPGRIQVGRGVRLEPDILAFPAPARREANWTDITSWWLAVEVLSPSTRVYDTEWKRQAYQALGVDEVWLVDPDAERVSVWSGLGPVPRVALDHLNWTPPGHAGPPAVLDVRVLFR
jgi:Uma2 family endonuclease